jgi:L-rhamnose isomerase
MLHPQEGLGSLPPAPPGDPITPSAKPVSVLRTGDQGTVGAKQITGYSISSGVASTGNWFRLATRPSGSRKRQTPFQQLTTADTHISIASILHVTDNSAMRRAVAAGQLNSWTAHSTTVVHMRHNRMSERSHEDMWVDMMMLSMADCLVTRQFWVQLRCAVDVQNNLPLCSAALPEGA